MSELVQAVLGTILFFFVCSYIGIAICANSEDSEVSTHEGNQKTLQITFRKFLQIYCNKTSRKRIVRFDMFGIILKIDNTSYDMYLYFKWYISPMYVILRVLFLNMHYIRFVRKQNADDTASEYAKKWAKDEKLRKMRIEELEEALQKDKEETND